MRWEQLVCWKQAFVLESKLKFLTNVLIPSLLPAVFLVLRPGSQQVPTVPRSNPASTCRPGVPLEITTPDLGTFDLVFPKASSLQKNKLNIHCFRITRESIMKCFQFRRETCMGHRSPGLPVSGSSQHHTALAFLI